MATPNTKDARKTGDAGQSARREKREVGGSNPSPRTIKPREHWRPFLQWGKWQGRPECPYFKRWLLDLRLFSIRLHHWVGSDDQRALHDHPWSFVTIILKGSYIDRTEDGDEHMTPGKIRFRPALHSHTVIATDCWSIIFTGPKTRKHGFWVDGKWRKSNKYFFAYGHHPCEET